jgi:nucleoside-diphosphate-sugar epimerase
MIVGKGLIASQLSEYIDNNEIIVFASGVSNSRETREELFERERLLIDSFIPCNKLFVYFSTCSVFDDSLADSMYVKHKLSIEKHIESNFKSYIILRLPNIIGLTNNNNTFFNFFFNAIRQQTPIVIQKNAVRYFMDVEDLSPILKMILASKSCLNTTINIAYNNPASIPDVLNCFETHMDKKANYSYTEKGSKYVIPNDCFNMLYFQYYNKTISIDYTENCIKKYIVLKNNLVNTL